MADLNSDVQQLHATANPSIFKTNVDSRTVIDYFYGVISKPRAHILIAEEENVSLGYVWFEIQNLSPTPFIHAAERTYIHHIAVGVDARRRGVGSLLLRTVEAEARARSIPQIILDTWNFNEGAQHFFSAVGYRPSRLILGKTIS